MKSVEFKKIEQKIEILCSRIELKELEKDEKQKTVEKLKHDIKALKIKIREYGSIRIRLNEELDDIQAQSKTKLDEMNRIKAGLVYKTKREYEEMIKRLENEMQNTHKYIPHEESRLLKDISVLRNGISQLEKYEEKKQIHDNLKKMKESKKSEQDENWNQSHKLKKELSAINEELKVSTKSVTDLDTELREMTNKKVELKKLLEDLSREHLIKQQQWRKMNEKAKSAKHHNKQDTFLLSLEAKLRDYNKLITYFYKLQNPSFDDSQDSSSSSSHIELSKSKHSFYSPTSNQSKQHFITSSSSTSSLISLLGNNNQNKICNGTASVTNIPPSTSQDTIGINRPFSLDIDKNISLTNDEDNTPSFSSSITPITPMTPMTPSVYGTPMKDESGSFIMKKKIDDEIFTVSNRRKHNNRKFKSIKSMPKISHTVDVINLLSKLSIPIELSSRWDECLNLLEEYRKNTIEELATHKAAKQAQKISSRSLTSEENNMLLDSSASNIDKKNSEPKVEPSVQSIGETQTISNFVTNSSAVFSDQRSDASSCLDSNYESDYSVSSSIKNDSVQKMFSFKKSPSPPSENVKFSLNYDDEEGNDILTTPPLSILERQNTIVNNNYQSAGGSGASLSSYTEVNSNERSSNIPGSSSSSVSTVVNNSDDSDVTVNDLQVNDNKNNKEDFSGNKASTSCSGESSASSLLEKRVIRKLNHMLINNGNKQVESSRSNSNSDGSNNTLAPCSPNSPKSENFDSLSTSHDIDKANTDVLNKLEEYQNKTTENTSISNLNELTRIEATNIESTTSLNSQNQQNSSSACSAFTRQISDGYCSSYTPLSASSLNNEHPTRNPFFANNNNNANANMPTMSSVSESPNTSSNSTRFDIKESRNA